MAEPQMSVFCKRKICVWGHLVHETLSIIEIILTYHKLRQHSLWWRFEIWEGRASGMNSEHTVFMFAIRLTNRCDFLYCLYFVFSLHVSGFHKPIEYTEVTTTTRLTHADDQQNTA